MAAKTQRRKLPRKAAVGPEKTILDRIRQARGQKHGEVGNVRACGGRLRHRRGSRRQKQQQKQRRGEHGGTCKADGEGSTTPTPETVAVGGSERRSSQRRRNPKPSVTWRTVVAYSEWSHPGSTGDGFVEGRIEEKIGKAGLCVWRWENAAVNSFFVYRNGAFSFSLFQHLLACYTLYIMCYIFYL